MGAKRLFSDASPNVGYPPLRVISGPQADARNRTGRLAKF